MIGTPRGRRVCAISRVPVLGGSSIPPVTIIGDHANLVDIEEVVHRCSLKAFIGWVLELAQMFAAPRVRAIMSGAPPHRGFLRYSSSNRISQVTKMTIRTPECGTRIKNEKPTMCVVRPQIHHFVGPCRGEEASILRYR